MPKVVKEFMLREETGEVNIEYDDNSTSSFNLVNAVTAIPSELGTELYAGGEVLALPGGVQVPSDWNAVAGVARILNKPTVLDAEAVQDLVAAMFAGSHTNLTATYNDATGTLTLSAASGGGGTTAEEVQDFLNTALVHANHTGVTVSYDDANNRFVFTAAGGGGAANLSLTTSATNVTVVSDVGTDAVIPSATTSTAGVMSSADKTKLNGIASGATANASDAQLRDRSTHTGAQAISAVTGLQTALDSKQASLVSGSNIKTVNGNSLLGSGDIAIAGGAANLTLTGDATTVSINVDTGTDVVIPAATATAAGVATAAQITKLNGIATAATANATDAQLRDRSTHTGTQAISTVTGLQTALDTKQAALVSGNNIKTVNGASILGSGDIIVSGGSSVSYAGTVFCDPAGNDSTAVVGDPSKPFATIYGAITGRGTARNFVLAPGTYDFVNNYMDMPVNSSFKCYHGRAKLLFSGTQHFGNEAADGRCPVNPAAGEGIIWLEGLDIEVGYDGVNLIGPIGISSYAGNISTTSSVFPTIHLYNCTVTGKTDILYGVGCKKFRIVATNCEFYSNWDVCYASQGCDFELNATDVYWRIKHDIYGQGDSAIVVGNKAKVALNSGNFYVDCSTNNTTADRTAWRGIIAQAGQDSRVYIGGAFKRVNVATGLPAASNQRDYLVQSFANQENGVGCITIEAEALATWLPTTGRNHGTVKTGPAIKTNGQIGFQLRSTVNDVPTCWQMDDSTAVQTIPLFKLPQSCYITRVTLLVVTAMGGTPTVATIEVGTAGNTTKYLAATSIKTASTQLVQVSTAGVEAFGNPHTAAGTNIIATVRTTGGNVNTGTGAVLYVFVETAGGNGFTAN